jgi:protease-4
MVNCVEVNKKRSKALSEGAGFPSNAGIGISSIMQKEYRKTGKSAVCWVFLLILAVVLFFSLVFNAVLFVGLFSRGSGRAVTHRGGVDEFPRLHEKWSYGKGDVKAVRIRVDGIIGRDSEAGLFAAPYDKVESIIRQVRSASNDEDVQAIVLEVNSPGGPITPTDEIYEALRSFKASREDRKIVVFMKGIAASGGYLVSMPGDWLIAEPTSLVGSIGVVIQTLNWKTASEKLGIHDVTIKSGANKDMLNPFREVDPEDLSMLQETVDTMHAHFVDIVLRGRDLSEEELKPLADGRIFTARQALELRLIDEIGYWEDVLLKTRVLLGEENVKFVRYERSDSFFDLMARVQNPVSVSRLMDAQMPRFLYLWRP